MRLLNVPEIIKIRRKITSILSRRRDLRKKSLIKKWRIDNYVQIKLQKHVYSTIITHLKIKWFLIAKSHRYDFLLFVPQYMFLFYFCGHLLNFTQVFA